MPEHGADAAYDPRDGRVVTFYSYKGGTGRTMALANVAWILAANGHRVLVADWDLESPGLHRFYNPFLEPATVREAAGIIDLIRDYLRAVPRATEQQRTDELIPRYARIQPYAVSLNWRFPDGGVIDFVSPGRQNTDYAATLGALDWDNFYESLSGGQFLDALRDDMKQNYDYVLIDSRTGLSDIAAICTVHFPDVLVDCFTLSTQGIEGAAQVARMIKQQHRRIRILPVPMRVDDGELEKVDVGRKMAMRFFDGIPADMTEAERRDYWRAVEVPYKPFYSFEETLAVFGEPTGAPGSLLSSFERIAARITEGGVTRLPEMDEQVRERILQDFTRRPPQEIDEITIEFGPEDQIWVEWIRGVLQGTEISVRERYIGDEDQGDDDPFASRTLTVISATYRERHRVAPSPPGHSDLALYVTPGRPLTDFPSAKSAFIADVKELEAIERLLGLVGVAGQAEGLRDRLPHYPGSSPKIDRSPARNMRFTGRESDLRGVRDELQESGRAVVLPVPEQGLGVGKTQIALEYVHRFKADYDLVWWLDCSQPEFIDASLIDLGLLIQENLGVAIPPTETVEKQAEWVLSELARGTIVPRWLLVYDNAEDIKAIAHLLPFPFPGADGHVLITSRNQAWSEQVQALPLEVFTLSESISHLRARMPSMTEAQAQEIAESLGNLPLAVALAGAWLAETAADPVQPSDAPSYLAMLRSTPPAGSPISQPSDHPEPLRRAVDISLERLRKRSPAALRLLELCSVMEARIAFDLLASTAMVQVLKRYDPALSGQIVIARTRQEVNRLALIKLDSAAQRVHVHRLVQAIVQERMPAEQLATARQDVQQVLVSVRPLRDVDDPETWPTYRLIWPHLEPLEVMTSQDELVRQLLVDRVRYLWIRHDLERGREFAAEAEKTWEAMLAAEPSPTAAAALRRQLLQLRFNLGNILRDLARFADARKLDEGVLAEQRKLLGPDHPDTLMTAGSLAADLRALGFYRESLGMDQVTYPAWLATFAEDDPPTLSAANNLADSYRMTADFTEALRVDEETLSRRRTRLGPMHPRTLGSMVSVARDLVELGRYAAAVETLESVRQSYLAVAEEPVAEWNAQVMLGIALRSAGRPRDAETHFREVLARLTRHAAGSYNSDLLSCQLSHAGNLLALRQPEAAAQEIGEVLASYDERLGPAHPHTLIAMLNRAEALRQKGQPTEALAAARSAASGLEKALSGIHPYALAAQVTVGVLLAEAGDLAAAAALEAPTAEGLRNALGESHPDALRSRANLLLTWQEQSNRQATAQLDDVIRELAAVIGAEHPHIAQLRQQRRLVRVLDPQPF
jgi:MinD-like ATPase involved in chromosome partitioning or flagellar assembly/tetratricopeptide (TPR) repeat protein